MTAAPATADGDNLIHAMACHSIACKAANLSPKTLVLYDGRYKQFLTFLQQQGYQPPFSMDLLSPLTVREAAIWLKEQSTGPRGGEATARSLVGTLKTWSAWLADEGWLLTDPLARLRRPKVTRVARQPFTQEEVRALIFAAAESRSATRDTAIILLLLDTGLRVAELCSLTVDRVDIAGRRLVVHGKGRIERSLYFGSPERRDGGRTVRALRQYLREREAILQRFPGRDQGHVFLGFDGFPLNPGGVRTMFTRLARVADVGHVFPHRFRHTFATLFLVRNPGHLEQLRGLLGHLSDDQYRTYVHLSQEYIAQRAGRQSLAEAWVGEEKDAS
jgi:site-specific recombinase XerD